MSLVTSFENSGFRYFTVAKLMEIRASLPKPLEGEAIQLARAISAALMEKQSGGKVDEE